MRTKYVASAPRGELCYELDLGRAFTRPFRTDAHFVQYTSPAKRRLNRDSGVVPTMSVIVIDVDCKHSHGTASATPEGWRSHMFCALSRLFADHPGGYWYETKGGGRIVYRLPAPQTITCYHDAQEWRRDYAVTLAHLENTYGIVGDQACSDWTRLFRLPHATRDGGTTPEQRWSYGSPNDIRALNIVPTTADLTLAKRSKAFEPARTVDYRPSGDGRGLLYHLLGNRGLLLRPWRNGAYIVKCPRHEQHSCGTAGDGSTVLYPPANGKPIGAVHCLHAGCANMTVRGWVDVFSLREVEEAREAAGMKGNKHEQ